jgi:hypothetical protein
MLHDIFLIPTVRAVQTGQLSTVPPSQEGSPGREIPIWDSDIDLSSTETVAKEAHVMRRLLEAAIGICRYDAMIILLIDSVASLGVLACRGLALAPYKFYRATRRHARSYLQLMFGPSLPSINVRSFDERQVHWHTAFQHDSHDGRITFHQSASIKTIQEATMWVMRVESSRIRLLRIVLCT